MLVTGASISKTVNEDLSFVLKVTATSCGLAWPQKRVFRVNLQIVSIYPSNPAHIQPCTYNPAYI